MLLEPLSEYLKARRLEFDRIESPRLEVLTPLADRLQRELSDGHQPQIVFVHFKATEASSTGLPCELVRT